MSEGHRTAVGDDTIPTPLPGGSKGDAMTAAKDITDAEILAAITSARAERGSTWATRWDLEERLPQYPPKVILAKCRSMLRRRLIEGCACGCSGQWEIVEETL